MRDNDDIEVPPNEVDPDFMASIRKKFASAGAAPAAKLRARRVRTIDRAADGRSARATGRTEQFNFRSSEGLKAKAVKAANEQGITLAEWMERAVERALDGHEGD